MFTLFAAAFAAQTAAAGRRDLGMSFLAVRPGPAEGRLGSTRALARRQRGGLLGWSLGFLGAEESGQCAEPVLANAVGRLRWAAGHLAVAFRGSALILLLGGLGLGLGHGAGLAQTVGSSLAQLPAVWAIGAVAALLYGVVPPAPRP